MLRTSGGVADLVYKSVDKMREFKIRGPALCDIDKPTQSIDSANTVGRSALCIPFPVSFRSLNFLTDKGST